MHDKVIEAFKALTVTIATYESDTFSASGEKITYDEANRIASELVYDKITDLVELDTLDGVIISEALENIRDND